MKPRDKEKKREYDKKWRAKNKDRLNEQRRLYYQQNKEAINARNKKYREENKGKVAEGKKKQYQHYRVQWIEYLGSLVELKCRDCGYDKTFVALDFHHVKDKVFHITSMMMKALTEKNKQLMKEEVEKCVVLCSNCHRELHWNEKREQLSKARAARGVR